MTAAVLSIRHETTYRYASSAGYTIQRLRMTPRTEPLQRTLQWQVATPGKRRAVDDAFGNSGHIMTMTQPHDEIRIVASGSVEVHRPDRGRIPEKMLLSPLAFTVPTRLTEPTEAVRAFAARHLGSARVDTANMLALADAIRSAVAYHPGTTETSSTAADALGLGVGVCQDHAHLFIACCHALALPVRYVSGYVYPGAVAHAASHAWVDAWVDDVDYSGWAAIDVTHACLQTEDYCRLAVGRDYESVAPVRGMRRGGGQEAMTVHVSVTRT